MSRFPIRFKLDELFLIGIKASGEASFTYSNTIKISFFSTFLPFSALMDLITA